jgi:RNA polymerase-binding transcription factor DksA
MAKKITTKKTTSKKTARSSAKSKNAAAKKTAVKKLPQKAVKAKPAAKKTAAKENIKKTIPVKKEAEKKTIKKKIAEEKAVKIAAVTKPRRKGKKQERIEAEIDFVSAAEARAKALEKIKKYNQKDLEHFKKIILDKRDEIIEQLQNLRDQMLDPTTGEYINENSPYSLHMAEQGTDAMEREKTYLYAQRENKFLGYLEDALKRIDSGTYGICIECIEEPQHLCETCPLIPKARLEAVPHSQLCLPIKQRQEKR